MKCSSMLFLDVVVVTKHLSQITYVGLAQKWVLVNLVYS